MSQDSSFASDALAGLSGPSLDVLETPVRILDEDSPHYQFLETHMLPEMGKLLKELRGRRFKDVQLKLSEGIRSLKEFQYVQWPEETTSSKRSQLRSRQSALEAHLEGLPLDSPQSSSANDHAFHASRDSLDSFMDLHSVDGDFEGGSTDGILEDDFGDNDMEKDDATSFTSLSNETPPTATSSLSDGDDPETRDQMHESIRTSLQAFILVLTHPQKTNRSCDIALECISQLVFRRYVSGRAGGRDDDSGSGSIHRETPPAHRPPNSLMHDVIVAVQKCGESSSETIQQRVIDCFEAIMNSSTCSVHELTMLLFIRRLYHIYLSTKSESCQKNAKRALMDIVSKTIQRMEDSPNAKHSLYYTDSYILMKRVVHLSAKALPGVDDEKVISKNVLNKQIFNNDAVDPKALNNKELSLELILLMIEMAGENIKTAQKFVDLIQSQLCVTLLKNCISNSTQVAYTSQRIFLVLVYKFKKHLKEEIQVFMKNIFLRVLESENSSFSQKAIVLESLRSMCHDPFLLTQIFLNYDCDVDGMRIYNDIVTNLGTVAILSTKEPSAGEDKELEEELTLGFAAVEVLVIILNTFLKTMGLEKRRHREMNDMAGKQIRKLLQLKEVGRLLQEMEEEEDDEQEPEEKTLEEHMEDPDIRASIMDQTDTLRQMVNVFDRKRNAEQSFELGAVKFTLSISGGLGFFIDHDFVKLDAKEVANFLFENREKLDKTQIGELLGKEPDNAYDKTPGVEAERGGKGFYLKVLYHYVDATDFSDMLFDEAIRLFLLGFRLPGEAQKIDRIMEKFAESYARQNPDVFSNSDTAFILAFSIIMLNTDLHNPSIKPSRRMTLESFQKNNRGIGENGTNLPDEFLAGIYQRIKKAPFSLKEDDALREKVVAETSNGGFFGKSAETHKKERFDKEKEEMMSSTVELILQKREKAGTNDKVLESVKPAYVVKPMFDATRSSLLKTFTTIMEGSVVRSNILVCLNGWQYAIKLACNKDMPEAQKAFVDKLGELTLFESLEDLNFKHVDALRTLMGLAVSDGEYLGEGWGAVLRCISRLATMRMKAEEILKGSNSQAFVKKRKSFARRFYKTRAKKEAESEESKEKESLMKLSILESVGDQLIDNVFSSTVDLSAQALESFTSQLIAVSMEELAAGEGGLQFVTDMEKIGKKTLETIASEDEFSYHSSSGELSYDASYDDTKSHDGTRSRGESIDSADFSLGTTDDELDLTAEVERRVDKRLKELK
ncbi:unnamed protein product [Cylindrotheca closterium]|uniref:SEC7 domain-containing protein n=1 Tax=Cylindrotheca closterium TaxID=2856 RepID=A0AAD2CLR0_9STRA|nr:unnamed protein product [Cylindrotheca closterium]